MQGVNYYKDNADDASLEQFVIEHRPLVKKIALYIKRRLPSYISLDDILQSGFVGLLEDKRLYQSGMGATFETYASIRIRGAILDALRKNSWGNRESSKNIRRIGDAITRIEQRDSKQASSEDIAAELGISIDEHIKMCQQISITNVVSLDAIDSDSDLIGDDNTNPFDLAQQDDLKKHLKSILFSLPEREQLVLSLYYIEEFTFKQIGEILEITEARVCQLHSQSIARIKAKMLKNKL